MSGKLDSATSITASTITIFTGKSSTRSLHRCLQILKVMGIANMLARVLPNLHRLHFFL
jgi:hypothetical protein